MKNLDNMTIKDLLKLVIKKLDKLAYDKTLEERLHQLEARVAVLESVNIHQPFINPNTNWYDNNQTDPTPWLPKIIGKAESKKINKI